MELKEVAENYRSIGQTKTETGMEYNQVAEWLEELEQLRIKEYKFNNLEGYKRCYLSLVTTLNEELVNPILGEDYYNYSCDTIGCYTQIYKDIKYMYDRVKLIRNIFIVAFLISSISLLWVLFR